MNKEKLISFENLEHFKNNLEATYGKPLGVAQLDDEGGILESQLPWAAFNVKEYESQAEFPEEGKPMRLYVDLSTNSLYRWDEENSVYVNTSSPESITYKPQELTEAQKLQARTNIGAMAQADLPSYDQVLYTPQTLTTEQKTQARVNIDAVSSSDMANLNQTVSGMNSTISQIQAAVRTLGDNVSDVVLIDEGLRIEYANGTSKIIEMDNEMPIKSVVYDDEHYLHFYDENGQDLFDNVYIAGGGGGSGTGGTIRIERITNETISSVYGAAVPIEFSIEAKDASGDDATLNNSYWTVGGIVVARNIPVSQGNNSFDIGPYLNAGTNTVKVYVSADTGGENDQIGTKTWKVNAVNMRFEWNYDPTQINTSSFTDSWTVYGDVEKTSHTLLDGVELETSTTSKTGATQTVLIPMQTHGVHTIEHWVTATIGGDAQSTAHQYSEMIFVELGNNTPIISIPMKSFTMNQYDTIRIPVVVYDPSNIQTDATLLLDDEPIGEWTNIGRNVQYWSYTPTTSGAHVLTVRCGITNKTIYVNVTPVELDIEEIQGYTFRFKAADFASNNAARAWESNGITATFSDNFDWINGGLHTETDEKGNLQQYFCIKAGTTMTINHKLFASDAKARGMNFKIIYKVRNCRNYDAMIAHCYSSVGLRMYAHEALFNSSGTTVRVPYGEDDYIELEYDVYPVSGFRYIMAWVDGVITSCRVYDANDSFVQAAGSQEDIVLGSEDCDLYIYMIKAYPNLISREGHIDNFIMDAPNAAEMANRYSRNNILDEGGNIDYVKLSEQNPDCRVWVWDMPYMTIDKDDKVKNCEFHQFWGNGDRYYQMSGTGTVKVQGTSSVKYVRGAANTDMSFKTLEDGYGNDLLANSVVNEDLYGNNNFLADSEDPEQVRVFTTEQARTYAGVAENEPLGPEWVVIERDENRNPTKYIMAVGMKLNDDSCPIVYSNTKVNFASCEQVNNMCNAMWYQRFNPYPSLTARDCMEFNMGVQFIKDSGDIPDDNHFVLWGDNKYHMYSIANMGNSKKNVHVFHDLSNPNEVCIEVNDNDKDQMRMVSDDLSEEDWSGKKFFGMRYPDTKNPRQEVRDAWQRLVTWMATSNPNAYTGERLAQAETYGNYTFRGHDRPGTQVLRGTVVTQYAGTYTHDTFERRMAKMLSECEDYMVMDSFVYHFVYLERHTMVDNVSKNNFWSSTDLIHWDVSKAYDMDTSDGNNNQGQMVFDYGNEYNDDIGGMKVFNGSDSVWFVFVANLYEACRNMFINREAAGAWSATAYHEFLLTQQRKVPERCWVECYWYDYLRTYEQNISAEWMTFLDGGQKTHQRKHYEYFEELYDSSKYRGTASTSQNVNFRAYTPNSWAGVRPKGEITVTMYNKMYISIDAGTTALAPIKAERGVPITINFSTGGTLNNTLIVINTASMIQAISGMEQLYPDTCVFSMAYRLRELTLGSTATGYQNTFLRTLSLDNNIMLEKLYVQNLPNANSALDLSNCPALTYLDATGSGFTAYNFADGGLLETAIINKPTSLSMINLDKLDDENLTIADYSALISLRFENTDGVDSFVLASNATALQIVRLIGIVWNMQNTTVLNRMLTLHGLNENNITIDQSVLAGSAYAPTMRQRNLDQYEAAWPNLEVTYGTLVEEFPVSFVNPDGTTIKDRQGNDYIQYVDYGQSIQDPVLNDLIDTPTMAPSQQYTYTFSGWQNITGAVRAARTVTATYDSATRSYRVRWFSQPGTMLKSAEVTYGSEVVYEDATHTFPPTKTDDEENLNYSVFTGWDKSTGYITEDTDVYAVWLSDYLPPTRYVDPANPSSGTNPDYIPLNQLNTAQIYAISKSLAANNYWDLEDYVDIKVGKDFEFSNVESRVLAENFYLNGSTFRDTGVQLFNSDSPTFTLAIDYEYSALTTDATLVACFNGSGSEGFRISCRSDNPTIIWGDRTNTIGNYGMKRGIVVLMHLKGSKNLYVVSNNVGSTSYGASVFEIELARTQDTNTNATLVFGGASSINGQIAYPAKGIIHWCKIWYANLGKNVIKQIANWPRETWRMKYAGSNRYYPTENTGFPVSATFIANAPLSNFVNFTTSSGGNSAGWDETDSFTFINGRCFSALPYEWQQIVKSVNMPITKFATTYTPTTTTVPAKMYIPAVIDVDANMALNQYQYSHEGTTIPWFINNSSRIFFAGITIPEDAQIIESNTDPTASSVMYTIKEGDIWVHINNNGRGYIYVSADTASKHGYFGPIAKTDTANVLDAADGGLWISASQTWTRSRTANYNNYYYIISNTGYAASYEYISGYRGVLLMFSI